VVLLLWGLFDDALYVEHEGERSGPYFPVSGPIPLHRYRAFKRGKREERTDRIRHVADQLTLPLAALAGDDLRLHPPTVPLTLPTQAFDADALARLSGNRRPPQREDVAKPLPLLDLDLFSPLERCIPNAKGEPSMIFQGLTPLLGSCLYNLWQAFRKSKLGDTLTTASWSLAASMANRGLSLCSLSAQRPNFSTGS
jgi:hypothetical protein